MTDKRYFNSAVISHLPFTVCHQALSDFECEVAL
jgi:hypothetical protein